MLRVRSFQVHHFYNKLVKLWQVLTTLLSVLIVPAHSSRQMLCWLLWIYFVIVTHHQQCHQFTRLPPRLQLNKGNKFNNNIVPFVRYVFIIQKNVNGVIFSWSPVLIHHPPICHDKRVALKKLLAQLPRLFPADPACCQSTRWTNFVDMWRVVKIMEFWSWRNFKQSPLYSSLEVIKPQFVVPHQKLYRTKVCGLFFFSILLNSFIPFFVTRSGAPQPGID